MASLSGHFLDVMRGLPTLVAFRRAEAQTSRIREVTERYRRASLDTLRIAFASSAVLELVSTLSVALVAVTVGLRLANGDLGLRHRSGGAAPGPRGVLAAAPRRRGVPRGRRGRGHVRARRRPAVALRACRCRRGQDRGSPRRRRHRDLSRPGRAGPRPRLVGGTPYRHHGGDRPLGRRQVDPAVRARRAARARHRPPPGRRRARRRRGVARRGGSATAAAALRRRQHRRQRAPRRPRRRRRRRLGGAPPGRPRGARPPAPAGSRHPARRGRRVPVRR